VSWNTRYLNLVEKNLTHTSNAIRSAPIPHKIFLLKRAIYEFEIAHKKCTDRKMKEPVCTRTPPAPKKTNLQIFQLPYFVSKNLP
ncbi:hypothetical protein P421_16190, partial [Heyndrickxia coagulans P38]